MVCEGKATEPIYINGLARSNRCANVEIDIPSEQGVPLTLVNIAMGQKVTAERRARKQGDVFLKYDEVWCVFDVDEHPNLNDARQLAHANGVLLAISNPCFELWLILHFRDQPGAQHRHAMQTILAKHIKGYDKNFSFSEVADGVDAATERSRRLDDEAMEEGEAGRNPTTGVYLLTDSICGKTVGQT